MYARDSSLGLGTVYDIYLNRLLIGFNDIIGVFRSISYSFSNMYFTSSFRI